MVVLVVVVFVEVLAGHGRRGRRGRHGSRGALSLFLLYLWLLCKHGIVGSPSLPVLYAHGAPVRQHTTERPRRECEAHFRFLVTLLPPIVSDAFLALKLDVLRLAETIHEREARCGYNSLTLWQL